MDKKILIIIGVIVGIIFLVVGSFAGTNNRTISLEEQVKSSKASIEVQEKRRSDLIVNLVDSVKSYNKFEADTMQKITEARTQAEKGNTEGAQLAINAVVEKYPDLKSQENYKALMTELAITENLIAEHRNNFNMQTRDYTRYVKSFPANMFLSIMGYERLDVSYTEYGASEDSLKNLFED